MDKDTKNQWKYGIHPLFKISIYILYNFFIFTTQFQKIRLYLFIGEIFLCVIIKIDTNLLFSFIKFISYSFLGIMFIFYWAERDWINALSLFIDYAFLIISYGLVSIIFLEITPTTELIHGLKKLHLPKTIIFALTIIFQFFPLILKKVHEILIYQKARGYKFNPFNLSPILIPLILNMMDLSMKISISLKSRGFEI